MRSLTLAKNKIIDSLAYILKYRGISVIITRLIVRTNLSVYNRRNREKFI